MYVMKRILELKVLNLILIQRPISLYLKVKVILVLANIFNVDYETVYKNILDSKGNVIGAYFIGIPTTTANEIIN